MRGHSDINWAEEHQQWIAIWKERHKYVLIDQHIQGNFQHMSHYMNWYWENSKVCPTQFATHSNTIATSHLTLEMETKQYPSLQSPLVVSNVHDEELQPPPQSYEFTPQQHYHQDYGYNP